MNLEDELHNLRRALDRAINDAGEAVSHSAMPPRARWGRSAPRAAIAAVCVVVVIAASVAVLAAIGRASKSLASRALAPSTTRLEPSTVPAGMRLVGFHGIEVTVPSAWNGGSLCAIPQGNTVMIEDGATRSCLVDEPHGLMVVRLGVYDPSARDTIAKQYVSIDGHPALRGTGTIRVLERVAGTVNSSLVSERLTVLVIPDVGVRVSVQGPDADAATRVLDSTRVVTVDALGCVEHRASLTPSGPFSHHGTSEFLVPGAPSRATICRYQDDWLVRSATVATDRVQRLVSILNALPAGVSQPGGGFSEVPLRCTEETRRGFVVQFMYPNRVALLVYVHIGGCKNLSASNGTRTTKIDPPLIDFLTSAAGYDGGISTLQ